MKLHRASAWDSGAGACISKIGSTSLCKLLSVANFAYVGLLYLCQAILINSTLKIFSGIELTSVILVHAAYAVIELTITEGSVMKKSFLGVNATWKQPFAEFFYKWNVDVWLSHFNIYNMS